MLELILGAAGTGKTTMLHGQIAKRVHGGGKAILLVPEQYSFESEKMLYRRLGARDALGVEVLSFTRLCDRIFRELGGLAGVHLDETAKFLLMSVVLGELRDGLEVYRKNLDDIALVSAMCEAVGELKTAGVEPESLRGIAENAQAGLAGKLADIALIFETYQALIERGYSDPDDSLRRACKKLEENPVFLEEYEVFIDGFMAFMGAEWRLLTLLLEFCPKLTVALPCEGLNAGGMGALSAPAQTALRLAETAKRCGAAVADPVLLREPVRFQNPALAALALELPHLCPTPFTGEAHGVRLVPCADFYDEIETVAAEIARLVREKDYRYREIVVIARSLDRYLVPLQTVFARYDIPFFTDLRTDIQISPLAAVVLGALEAVRGHFPGSELLALAKNAAIGIDPVDAALLENYCFTWSVEGGAWETDFVNHPSGMAESFTAEQEALLARINVVRQKLMRPLLKLRDALDDCDGREFAAAVFAYLDDCGATDNLQTNAEGMTPDEAKPFLETSAQVWDILIGVLEVFGGALGQAHFKLARFIDLFRMSVAAADIGNLPQTIDQVIVGAADRIRPNAPRAAFVIGLNEGEFPRWDTSGGLFSPAERSLLRQRGVDILRTPEQTALFERYYLYFALTQASERLTLSWPMQNTAGAALAPSGAVEQVRELLSGAANTSPDSPLARIANEKTAFDAMARGWREESPVQTALRAGFAMRDPLRMQQLAQAAGTRTFSLRDGTAARELFGKEMRVSPSKVERYYSCPFSYFCQVGLRLGARRRVEFNPIESGSLIHLVLERMVKKYGGKGLAERTDAQLRAETAQIIEEDLSARISDLDAMPERFKYLFRRLVNTLARLLRRLALEFAQCEFEPEAFELPIALDAETQPLELYAPDGTRVVVEGVVDRVDVLRRGDKKYVRVVDYKSGRKSFNLSDVYYGLNMQMLIYLFSICANPVRDADAVLPAGVLYMPARDSVISSTRHAPDEEIRAERLKRLKMNGILLEDREVLSAMEPDLAGVFIPAKEKKSGGFDAYSSLANLAEMGKIRRQVETMLSGLAESLYDGKIEALPAEGQDNTTPCVWCDYHAVCGHEDGDPVRRLAAIDKETFYQQVGEEETDG